MKGLQTDITTGDLLVERSAAVVADASGFIAELAAAPVSGGLRVDIPAPVTIGNNVPRMVGSVRVHVIPTAPPAFTRLNGSGGRSFAAPSRRSSPAT